MEEMDMKMKKYHILISVCMAAVWIFLINRFAGIVFETNDDRMITEIFSGAMTGAPEAHAYYVDYILGFILSSLYSITADVPWYGGMLALFQLLCWFFIADAFLSRCENKRDVLFSLLCCGVLYGAGFYIVSSIQFTSTAAMLAITGYVCLLLYPQGKGRYILFLMFELLAYLLRSDAMLMIQPLGVLTFTAFYFMKNKLYRIKGLSVKEWMGKCRPLFYTAGILLGILALGKGSYLIFYSSEGWKEYEKVIGALMDITDYADIPDYEDVADILEKYGVTEKQYSAFGQYMMIEENLSGDCLLEVAEVAGRQEIRPELSQLGRGLLESYTTQEYWNLNLLLLAAWAVLLFAVFWRKAYGFLLSLGGILLARSGLWAYLIYGGRMPPRVMVPLYLGEITMLLCLLLLIVGRERPVCSAGTKRSALELCLPLLLVLALLPFGAYTFRSQYRHLSEKNAVEEVYFKGMEDMISYCDSHPDKRFFIDASSLIYYRGSAFETQIFRQRNAVATGCWYAGSPGFLRRLKDYFADCETIYLVASAHMGPQSAAVVSYLEERLGTEARLEESFTVSNGGEYLVYAFRLPGGR